MSNTSATTVMVSTVQLALTELLAGYQSEQAESRRDEDTYFIEYWNCACQTIYDVAAALHIPFEESSEEQPSQRRPYKHPYQPDSLTPDTADVGLSEGHDPKPRLLRTDSPQNG